MMSTNPGEPKTDKETKANTAKVVERSGFGLFGTLPFIGMGNKKDAPPEPLNVDKNQQNANQPESTKTVVNQPTSTEIANSSVQATTVGEAKPAVQSQSISVATKTVSAKLVEPKTNPSGGSKPASQAPITGKTKFDAQAETVGKVKAAVENPPADEVGKEILGVKQNESKKPDSSEVAESVKSPGQSKNIEMSKLAANSGTTETKNNSEMINPVENSMADEKAKTSESNESSGKPADQAPHSLGGESANQFTPPLPDDFLKNAQAKADESKQDNGSNVPSRVNSQIPSAKLLEGKTEDLLLAPIIPRPKKRPAAKSLMKQLGQSHLTRPLKKVKLVKAKTEKKSAGRPKSSPGRGRATKSKSSPGRGHATKSKSPAQRSQSSKKAKLLSEGPPTEALESGWPDGWVRRVFERASGATKGSTDKYWYSPINGVRLRSIVEVRRFLKALEKTNGDENEAKKMMKTITL